MRYSNENNYEIAEESIAKGEPVTYVINTTPVKKLVNSHYHTYYEFTFMLSGEQHMIIENDTYTTYSGQFFFLLPTSCITDSADKPRPENVLLCTFQTNY